MGDFLESSSAAADAGESSSEVSELGASSSDSSAATPGKKGKPGEGKDLDVPEDDLRNIPKR